MKAVGKYIVIIPKKEPRKKTASGLLLGEKDREDVRYREATIQSIGTEVNGVKSGDHIYYDKFAGDIIEIEDDTYTVIKESDVIIVL
jgi:chaperonin GroES